MTDPLFTPEQVKDDGRTRVGKSIGQGGTAAAIVTLGEALFQSHHWMHGALPTAVSGAFQVVLIGIAAGLMNLSKLRGKQ